MEGPDAERGRRWARLKAHLEAEPYWRLLGICVEEIGQGYCRLRLPLSKGVRNLGRGPAHGGALASLVDTAVGTALDMPNMSGHTTVALNVSFLAAATAEAVLAEAELRAGAGQLIAKGGATYLVWRQREV